MIIVMKNKVEDFLDFLDVATTPFQTVLECERRLKEAGFERLYMNRSWSVGSKGKYYVIPHDSMLVAFTVGDEMHHLDRFKVVASHIDTPGFKIKPLPEIINNNYMKLNTEVYGGPILNTWMDRILSFAGKVSIKSDDVLKPTLRYIDIKKPIMTIPNLAIHMNREVNKGVELNKQKDMIPIIGQVADEIDKEKFLMDMLAEALKVKVEDILDFDLHIYLAEKGTLIGVDESMISAPRMDDLAMAYASIEALIRSNSNNGINISVCYDNEEVGSTSKQGADSKLLSIICQRIFTAYNKIPDQLYRVLPESLIISADAAHAVHPNLPEKNDPTNKAIINKGIVIKMNANKNYGTDCETSAIIRQLCEKAEIDVQTYVNRSDQVGGKSLGPIIESQLAIKAVDIGIPMLAMHSAREVIGAKDLLDSIKLFETFYNV